MNASDINWSCGTVEKTTFWQLKIFLGIVTVFAVLLMSFPLYAEVFYQKTYQKTAPLPQVNNIQTVTFSLKGMSCEAYASHVNSEAAKIEGVANVKTSYAKGISIVKFDRKQTIVV